MSTPAKQESTKELKTKNASDKERKLQEIFHQIDLAQARINKEQEEIQFLSKETDKLLDLLEFKVS
jgi:hypothetical protein